MAALCNCQTARREIVNALAFNIFKARLPTEFNRVDGDGKPHNIG